MTKQTESVFIDKQNVHRTIDFISMLKKIWLNKGKIIKTTILFMMIGLFIAIFSETEYSASTTIVTQSAKKNGGNLSSIAALAGLNLGGLDNGIDISPQLYPKIVNSISFQKDVLDILIPIGKNNNVISYRAYYTDEYSPSLLKSIKKYTIGLPAIIMNSFRTKNESRYNEGVNNQPMFLSVEDRLLIDLLKNQLNINVNDKDGYITLSAKLPKAKAVAKFVKEVQILLERYVVAFKIEKSRSQLNFIKQRYKEQKVEFKNIEQKLAIYVDQNQNVNSALAKVKLNSLQSEYDLAFGIYSELAKQLETQELKVKEDTPIFTIIDPVFIPTEKESPKRFIIILLWTFLGGILSISYLLTHKQIKKILKEIKKK